MLRGMGIRRGLCGGVTLVTSTKLSRDFRWSLRGISRASLAPVSPTPCTFRCRGPTGMGIALADIAQAIAPESTGLDPYKCSALLSHLGYPVPLGHIDPYKSRASRATVRVPSRHKPERVPRGSSASQPVTLSPQCSRPLEYGPDSDLKKKNKKFPKTKNLVPPAAATHLGYPRQPPPDPSPLLFPRALPRPLPPPPGLRHARDPQPQRPHAPKPSPLTPLNPEPSCPRYPQGLSAHR